MEKMLWQCEKAGDIGITMLTFLLCKTLEIKVRLFFSAALMKDGTKNETIF